MSAIVAHSFGALSLFPDSGERQAQDRDHTDRLEALDPEQFPQALSFIAGYAPLVLDAALEAVEPPPRDLEPELEPFCTKCQARVAVFQAHGPDYKHYRGTLTPISKPKPYKADHPVALGWRPATDIPAWAS
jgi:hypothetical protein